MPTEPTINLQVDGTVRANHVDDSAPRSLRPQPRSRWPVRANAALTPPRTALTTGGSARSAITWPAVSSDKTRR